MSRLRYALAASAFLSDVVLATKNQFVSADLVWPKPQSRYDIAIDDETVAPAEQLGVYSAWFPCYYVPVPENVERIPWPIQGGRIQVELTSDLWSSDDEIDNDSMGWWGVMQSFGQFRGLDVGSETIQWTFEDSSLPPIDSIGPSGYNRNWKLGTSCLPTMPTLDQVQEDRRLHLEHGEGIAPMYNVTIDELEGVEATLGVKFGYHVPHHLARYSDSVGDVFAQCVYVRFTSEPVEGPRCRPDEPTGPDSAPTSLPTSEPSPPGGSDGDESGGDREDEEEDDEGAGSHPPTDEDPGESPSAGDTGPQNPQANSTLIGVAAGVSSAVAIGIIILAFWLLRRRRARRALAASALATVESGLGGSEKKKPPRDDKKAEAVEKKKGKKVAVDCDLIMVQEAVAAAHRSEMVQKGKKVDDGSDDASSSASVYSEPLPKYEKELKE